MSIESRLFVCLTAFVFCATFPSPTLSMSSLLACKFKYLSVVATHSAMLRLFRLTC